MTISSEGEDSDSGGWVILKMHSKDELLNKAVFYLLVSLMLLFPSQAYSIVTCYDYVQYRLYNQDKNPPPPGYANEILGLPLFPCGKPNEPHQRRVMVKRPLRASRQGDAPMVITMLNEKNYRKEIWTAGMAPPSLDSYDVIKIPGHMAFVNENGGIDHFIQIPGSSQMESEYFPNSLSGVYWTKDQVEKDLLGPLCKTVKDEQQGITCICGGVYKGDTFQRFLSRTTIRAVEAEIWRNPGLTVYVLDSSDQKPVPLANVDLRGKGRKTTDEKGEAVFKINPFQDSNFSVSVSKAKYESKDEPLSSSHIVYLKAIDPVKLSSPAPVTPPTAPPTTPPVTPPTTPPATPPVTPPTTLPTTPPIISATIPPAPKKLTALAATCPTPASVGDTVQCMAVGIYDSGSPTEVTNQVTWTPYTSRFSVLRKPESGFISVAYSYLGFSGTVYVMVVEKSGSSSPAIPPPPPPPPPPGAKKLAILIFACDKQVQVGGRVQCKALAQFEGESALKDVTDQATWKPSASFNAPLKKPESGYVTVTVTYWGESGTEYIKVVDPTGYNPNVDPGLPGRDKPVDPSIQGYINAFATGLSQGTRPPGPKDPQTPIPQPTDYTKPPGYLSSTTTTTMTTIPAGSTTIPTTTVPPGGTTIPATKIPPVSTTPPTTIRPGSTTSPTTIRPGSTTSPTTIPKGGGSASQKYAVFLVENVFGGAGYSVVVDEVASSFLKGKKYQKKSADFNTKKEADKAYCDALQSNPRSLPLTGGYKAKIYGGDYWVGDATPTCPKKP